MFKIHRVKLSQLGIGQWQALVMSARTVDALVRVTRGECGITILRRCPGRGRSARRGRRAGRAPTWPPRRRRPRRSRTRPACPRTRCCHCRPAPTVLTLLLLSLFSTAITLSFFVSFSNLMYNLTICNTRMCNKIDGTVLVIENRRFPQVDQIIGKRFQRRPGT